MGVIRKLYANRNVGADSNNSNLPTEGTEVYPVTSAKAVFLNNNINGLFSSSQQTKELEAILNQLYTRIQNLELNIEHLQEDIVELYGFHGVSFQESDSGNSGNENS